MPEAYVFKNVLSADNFAFALFLRDAFGYRAHGDQPFTKREIREREGCAELPLERNYVPLSRFPQPAGKGFKLRPG
jgi:hypothetical protein